jgi:hypothetical protein
MYRINRGEIREGARSSVVTRRGNQTGSRPSRAALNCAVRIESHSAPKRSESGTGRHGLTCGIARHPACSGDSLRKDGGMEAAGRVSAPEMGNRQSSGHHLGRVAGGSSSQQHGAGES